MFLGCPRCKFITNKMSNYRKHEFFHHVQDRKPARNIELNEEKLSQDENSPVTDPNEESEVDNTTK